MKQPCALIVGLIFTAGITAVSGAGSQPISEPTVKKEPAVKKTTTTVDATAIYNKGVALMHEKKFAAAIADFEAAIKAKPDFAEAHNNLAYCLRSEGPAKYREALDHYNKAIQLNPNLAQAYEYRGVLFVKMNRKGDAEKDLAKLKQLDPKLASKLEYAINNKGQEKEGY